MNCITCSLPVFICYKWDYKKRIESNNSSTIRSDPPERYGFLIQDRHKMSVRFRKKSQKEFMLNGCFIAAALVSADIVYKRLSGIARQLELTSATLLQNVRAGSFGELKRSENFCNRGVNTDELIEISFSGSHFHANSKALGNFTSIRR